MRTNNEKYQRLAEQIREQIASGVWQPGDRLPSLREQVASSGMSFMTVGHAYQLLESQGGLSPVRNPVITLRHIRFVGQLRPRRTLCGMKQ